MGSENRAFFRPKKVLLPGQAALLVFNSTLRANSPQLNHPHIQNNVAGKAAGGGGLREQSKGNPPNNLQPVVTAGTHIIQNISETHKTIMHFK